MNNLQKLETRNEYFVTINPEKIPENTHNETFFTHPKFNLQTMKSQSKLKDLQGINNTFFCGLIMVMDFMKMEFNQLFIFQRCWVLIYLGKGIINFIIGYYINSNEHQDYTFFYSS